MTTKNILIALGAVVLIVAVIFITNLKKEKATNDTQTDSVTGESSEDIDVNATTSVDGKADSKPVSPAKTPDSKDPVNPPTFPKTGFEPKN